LSKQNLVQTLIFVSVACLILLVGSAMTIRHYLYYKAQQPMTTLPSGSTEVPDGLVGHWEFESVSDNSTPNSSIHSNDGEFKSFLVNASSFFYGPPKLIDGVHGNALEFSGKQWIAAGNKNCFNTDIFTLAVWVWQEDDKDVFVPTIMSKSDWPKYNGWWLCTATEDSGMGRDRDVNLAISWGNDFAHIKSGYQLPLKEWHHVAVTMDNKKHEVQFYIDGEAYGPPHTDVPEWLINWNHDMFVADYDGSGRWTWVGKLDDVRFYKGVLSPEEIAAVCRGESADIKTSMVAAVP